VISSEELEFAEPGDWWGTDLPRCVISCKGSDTWWVDGGTGKGGLGMYGTYSRREKTGL